jgi:hypothetical protein
LNEAPPLQGAGNARIHDEEKLKAIAGAATAVDIVSRALSRTGSVCLSSASAA